MSLTFFNERVYSWKSDTEHKDIRTNRNENTSFIEQAQSRTIYKLNNVDQIKYDEYYISNNLRMDHFLSTHVYTRTYIKSIRSFLRRQQQQIKHHPENPTLK